LCFLWDATGIQIGFKIVSRSVTTARAVPSFRISRKRLMKLPLQLRAKNQKLICCSANGIPLSQLRDKIPAIALLLFDAHFVIEMRRQRRDVLPLRVERWCDR
jgi:hypothetical protein